MKRRPFFLGLVVASLVWGAGAIEARAGSFLLSDLLVNGKPVALGNGLDITFDNYVSPTVPASEVTVTIPIPGTTTPFPGFTLNGAFGARPDTTSNADLVYTITATAPIIEDILLTGNPNPVGTGTGLASVTETVHKGTSLTGQTLANLSISNTTTLGPVTATFAPQTAITVIKNIESMGGNLGVSLSSVTQAFSVVPEPSSMALLGISMSGLLALRRFMKRRAVV